MSSSHYHQGHMSEAQSGPPISFALNEPRIGSTVEAFALPFRVTGCLMEEYPHRDPARSPDGNMMIATESIAEHYYERQDLADLMLLPCKIRLHVLYHGVGLLFRTVERPFLIAAALGTRASDQLAKQGGHAPFPTAKSRTWTGRITKPDPSSRPNRVHAAQEVNFRLDGVFKQSLPAAADDGHKALAMLVRSFSDIDLLRYLHSPEFDPPNVARKANFAVGNP